MAGVTNRAIEIFRRHGGIMHSGQAFKSGIHRNVFYRMRREGIVEKISRGLYRLKRQNEFSNPDLVMVALIVEKGVICLISALAFHEITTQIPHAVDVAISPGIRPAVIDHPPVNYYWFGSASYEAGVEEHNISGIKVRVYSAEKTLADCFKFRNKIGLDTALEALNLYRRRRRVNIEEIMKYARICRVAKVMRPYLEAIV